MRKLMLIPAVLLAATFVCGAAAETEQRSLAGEVVRLHVVANSDSEEDQRVKLEVRDAIVSELFAGRELSDADEAVSFAAENIPLAEEIANRVLSENGAPYSARARVDTEAFGTRDYGAFALPAGEYRTVRIELGSAAGKNWWCVMFPPLCLGEYTSDEAAQVAREYGADAPAVALMTEKSAGVEVKFRVLEFFEWIKSLFGE